MPIRAGVLGHHKVKGLRTEPFGELLGSHNYLCADYESRFLEFIQAVLNLRRESMNKQDSHKISFESKRVGGRGWFHALQIWFWFRGHSKPTNEPGGSPFPRPTAPNCPGSVTVTP